MIEKQKGHVLIGRGREITPIPDAAFVRSVKALPARMASRLKFMSRDHHIVRDFAVRELPRERKPLSPARIADVTALSLPKVSSVLDDLEKNLFFLVRDRRGDVSWAFPVTASRTPHRRGFSTGDNVFGA